MAAWSGVLLCVLNILLESVQFTVECIRIYPEYVVRV